MKSLEIFIVENDRLTRKTWTDTGLKILEESVVFLFLRIKP